MIEKIGLWGDSHHPRWMDIVRMALGIFLIYKGVDFLMHMSHLLGLMSGTQNFSQLAFTLAGHYVVFAHILGGIALVLGVYTRLACLLQLPILLGAVFFVNSNPEMLQPYAEGIIAFTVLLLLVIFLVVGNGPWSLKIPEDPM